MRVINRRAATGGLACTQKHMSLQKETTTTYLSICLNSATVFFLFLSLSLSLSLFLGHFFFFFFVSFLQEPCRPMKEIGPFLCLLCPGLRRRRRRKRQRRRCGEGQRQRLKVLHMLSAVHKRDPAMVKKDDKKTIKGQ